MKSRHPIRPEDSGNASADETNAKGDVAPLSGLDAELQREAPKYYEIDSANDAIHAEETKLGE